MSSIGSWLVDAVPAAARNIKLPIRAALVALVAAALLPAFVLIHLQLESSRAEQDQAMRARGRDVAATAARLTERMIRERLLLLRTLASSQNLSEGRLANFHKFAEKVSMREDVVLTVTDANSRMVLSTAVPFGGKLPDAVDEPTLERARQSGKPQISDPFRSPFRPIDVVSVAMLASEGGYVLRITWPQAKVTEVLSEIAPPNWSLIVLDKSDQVIAQSDQTSGLRLGQFEPIPSSRVDGNGEITSIAHRDGLLGFWRQTEFGWTIVAVAKQAAISPANASPVPFYVFLVVGIGVLLALASAVLIERPLRRLVAAAQSLGAPGLDAQPIASFVTELEEVGAAIFTASRLRTQIEAQQIALLEEVNRQKLLFQSVFASSPDCILVTDNDRRILEVNPAVHNIFGYTPEAIRGKSTRTIYALDSDWNRVGSTLSDKTGAIPVAFDAIRKDGESFPAKASVARLLDNTGEQRGYLAIVRDVGEEQRRDAALVQRQQMETLGRLTGGIAHDFNNLLTVISGHLQLIDERNLDLKQQARLAASLNATEMGARLNQRLMTFARQRDLSPTRIEINELILSMVDLIQRAIGEHIELRTSLAPEPLWVLIDESEFENALLNLSLNARDAMTTGGRLTITTKLIADADKSACAASMFAGPIVLIEVADTGTGMAPSVLSRAFEPFFTTKPVGKGTGLGLSSIHGFVRQSHGHVWIDSRLKAGTTVNIQLPLVTMVDAKPIQDDEALPLAAGETILVVEDNPAVAALTRDHLVSFGYRVLMAHNGLAAIRSLEEGEHVDLLFSDVIMPGGLSGYQLAEHCADLYPTVKILLTSGFPEAEGRAEACYARLNKPYSQAALARAIRAALQ